MLSSVRIPQITKKCIYLNLHRGLYSAVKGVPRDWLAKLAHPIDLSPAAIQQWLRAKRWEALVKDHRYKEERHKRLGPDLATAHFVTYRGGAVKFKGSNIWIEKDSDGHIHLPNMFVPDLKLEAIDVSSTEMNLVSFENFVNLDIKYLNVSKCKYIDDFCLDQFVMFRHSLLSLDITECPLITDKGIASLHKLRKLRILRMYDMPNVQQKGLLSLMLEDVLPHCQVESEVDYTDPASLRMDDFISQPRFGNPTQEDLDELPGRIIKDMPLSQLRNSKETI